MRAQCCTSIFFTCKSVLTHYRNNMENMRQVLTTVWVLSLQASKKVKTKLWSFHWSVKFTLRTFSFPPEGSKRASSWHPAIPTTRGGNLSLSRPGDPKDDRPNVSSSCTSEIWLFFFIFPLLWMLFVWNLFEKQNIQETAAVLASKALYEKDLLCAM